MVGRKNAVRLTHEGVLKLGMWLVANKEKLLKEKPSQAEMVLRVKHELDLEVTKITLSKIQENVQVQWTSRSVGGGPGVTAHLSRQQRLMAEMLHTMIVEAGASGAFTQEQMDDLNHIYADSSAQH
jgi:hypothetical protein